MVLVVLVARDVEGPAVNRSSAKLPSHIITLRNVNQMKTLWLLESNLHDKIINQLSKSNVQSI